MPKYKSPDGLGVNIGGEWFAPDADGCITVESSNYHSLLEPIGYLLQSEAPLAVAVPPVVPEPVAVTLTDSAHSADAFTSAP